MTNLDTDKIDDAVLALLLLGLHDGCRAWKSFDWDAMSRLHEKGLISDPVAKAKSVMFTEAGLQKAAALLQALFGAGDALSPPPASAPAAARAARRSA